MFSKVEIRDCEFLFIRVNYTLQRDFDLADCVEL